MNIVMCMLYKGEIVFFNSNEYFFQKALENSIKQVWPKIKQQVFAPFLATHWPHMALVISIFGHSYAHTDSY